MAFFIYNAAFSRTKAEKISSFILYMATCLPFIYILKDLNESYDEKLTELIHILYKNKYGSDIKDNKQMLGRVIIQITFFSFGSNKTETSSFCSGTIFQTGFQLFFISKFVCFTQTVGLLNGL